MISIIPLLSFFKIPTCHRDLSLQCVPSCHSSEHKWDPGSLHTEVQFLAYPASPFTIWTCYLYSLIYSATSIGMPKCASLECLLWQEQAQTPVLHAFQCQCAFTTLFHGPGMPFAILPIWWPFSLCMVTFTYPRWLSRHHMWEALYNWVRYSFSKFFLCKIPPKFWLYLFSFFHVQAIVLDVKECGSKTDTILPAWSFNSKLTLCPHIFFVALCDYLSQKITSSTQAETVLFVFELPRALMKAWNLVGV